MLSVGGSLSGGIIRVLFSTCARHLIADSLPKLLKSCCLYIGFDFHIYRLAFPRVPSYSPSETMSLGPAGASLDPDQAENFEDVG